MNRVSNIISLLESPTDADIALITKAYTFAEHAHRDQKRNSGEPYFNHLYATAYNLSVLHMSPVTIAAGLLHDTIEDVPSVTPEIIETEFGSEIRFLVEGVTKLGQLKYRGAVRHNESLRKLFVAMSQDMRVLIIKLADRLHNMQTLSFVPEEKRVRIAKETLEIYAPLAYRLGIKKLQRELEDIAFAYVYPKEFKHISDLIGKKQHQQEESLQKFHRSLKQELGKNSITNFKTEYRVKGMYSLYKKLAKYEDNIEKIYDLSALRIIVPTIADCYRVLGIVHAVWRPLPGRIKDYIALPKTNGYQSIHTTVFTGDGGIVEVQIRTQDMHNECEYGIASHMSYKQGVTQKKLNPNLLWIKKILPKTPQAAKTKTGDVPQWIKELVEYQQAHTNDEFMDNMKNDFLEERIFVFTPKGDVVDLPIGSTVIDFAYSIHSDIGNHMSGATVNGKFVALDTLIHNGDRVSIETRPSAKPSRKWLDKAKTTLAKRHIRGEIEGK